MPLHHALVYFKMNTGKPSPEYLWTTSRSWMKMSHSSFEADLKASRLCTNIDSFAGMSVDEPADLYYTTLLNLLNTYCPAVKMRRRFGALTPWSMPSATAAADIREYSRGDIVEHDRMLTVCHDRLSAQENAYTI